MNEIGKRLRTLREGVRLTQVNMAEILGVQQSRINRYETGQSTPGPEVFIKYADILTCQWIIFIAAQTTPGASCTTTSPRPLKRKRNNAGKCGSL